MDKYTATELAYKNGYENGYNQAIKDFEQKLKKKIDDNSKWFGKFYKFSVLDAIDKITKELLEKET
jgi:hypothetical protein